MCSQSTLVCPRIDFAKSQSSMLYSRTFRRIETRLRTLHGLQCRICLFLALRLFQRFAGPIEIPLRRIARHLILFNRTIRQHAHVIIKHFHEPAVDHEALS